MCPEQSSRIHTLHLLGIDEATDQSAEIRTLFKNAAGCAISKRHLALYEDLLNENKGVQKINIAPVKQCLEEVETKLLEGDVIIFASGDPLFFGIGRLVLERFPTNQVHIHPALSSMQRAFAKFQTNWDDARFISLHGRNHESFVRLILNYPKTFLFTDRDLSPDRIASTILAHCGASIDDRIQIDIAENLGMDNQRIRSGRLSEVAGWTFSPLNVMLIQIDSAMEQPKYHFGLSEDEIFHSRGLITKSEVRSAAIHSLRLNPNGVFWDIGGGSGSVGLEAARLFSGLSVFTVEAKEEQIKNIERNRVRFETWNLTAIHGSAPEALSGLQRPHSIFIGGSGGRLKEIICLAAEQLLPGGTILVNSVTQKTSELAPRYLASAGLEVEISSLSVTRRTYPAGECTTYNPIDIITGRKRVTTQ